MRPHLSLFGIVLALVAFSHGALAQTPPAKPSTTPSGVGTPSGLPAVPPGSTAAPGGGAGPRSNGAHPPFPAGVNTGGTNPVAGSLGESFFKNVGGFDRIQSETVNFNFETGNFSLPDHFTAVREGTDISADHATGNSRRKELHAVGHVVVHQTKAVKSAGKTSELTQKPSTLVCDKLDVDGVRHLYVATGHVHFTQEKRSATADSATLDDAEHHLHLEGSVHIADGDQTLDAQVVDYDTQSGEIRAEKDVTIVAPVPTATPGVAKPAATGKPKKKHFL